MGAGWRFAVICVVVAAGCRSAERPAPPKPIAERPASPKPVMGVRELMQSVLNPNAGVVWGAVSTVVTTAGIDEKRPQSDAEWGRVRTAAVTITRAGNQLMLSPRATDGSRWMKAAQALIDTSTAAMRAAEAKNADQLFSVGGEMYSACLTCHENYMSGD
jgi:hypothetical protein